MAAFFVFTFLLSFCVAGMSTYLVHMQDGDTLTAKSDVAASTGVLGQVRVAE